MGLTVGCTAYMLARSLSKQPPNDCALVDLAVYILKFAAFNLLAKGRFLRRLIGIWNLEASRTKAIQPRLLK